MLRHRKEKTTPFDVHTQSVMLEMTRVGPSSPEYEKMLTYLERLTEVKAKDTPKPASRDTLVTVAGNLASVFLIVAYEQKHVLTSKALSLYRPK